MYQAICPACGEEDTLEVIGGKFTASKMFLHEDGFSFVDARQIDTEDEIVSCRNCGKDFSLASLTLDE
jgi:uncharacterized Zn finger protein